MKPKISIIVAVAADGAIGRNGDLIVRLRPDMRHFRQTTMGHPIIMGRKTWESLPNGALPGRRNIVISRNEAFNAPGADVFQSIEDALASLANGEEAIIMGGGQIYSMTLPYAERIYLTEIDTYSPDADTFFPKLNSTEWKRENIGEWATDPDTGLKYRFSCLVRK